MTKRRLFFIGLIIILISLITLWFLGTKQEKELNDLAIEKLNKDQQLLFHNQFLENLIQTGSAKNQKTDKSLNKIYYISDLQSLNINESKTAEAILLTYAEEIKQALKPYSVKRPNDAELVLEALRTNNLSSLNQLQINLKRNQATIDLLLTIPVPESAKIFHLRLISSLTEQQKILSQMLNLPNNPEQALLATQKYPYVASDFFRAVDNLNLYFEKNGIMFSKDESLNLYYNL